MSQSRPHTDSLRLAAIVESSADAIISKDLDGIVTSWNRAAERMFGYTAEEAVGRSIRTIIPDERQFEEDAVLERIRAGERVEHFETERRHKDGTLVPIATTVSPILDTSGQVIGASTIARDISATRRSAVALDAARAAQADLQHRLRALVEASADVLSSPRVDDVLGAVLAVAGRVLQADGFAIWRLGPAGSWQIRAFAGVSQAFASHTVTSYQQRPVSTIPFLQPLIVHDVRSEPLLSERVGLYTAEGIVAMAAIPLVIGGQPSGTLVLYYRSSHQFTDVEIETARGLGNMTAAALTAAELYEEQRRLRDRASFLAQASTALAGSLDLAETANTVLRFAVPAFADACAIQVLDEGGGVELAVSTHVDDGRRDAMRKLASRPNPAATRGWGRTLREGVSELIVDITPAEVRETLRDAPDLVEAFDELAFTSQISVPMFAHGRLVGAVTFDVGEGRPRYTTADLELAEDLGRRCGAAIDNARLYEEAQRREAEAAWAEHRATFLADVGSTLASSLDYYDTLRTVARLAVPRIADWCAVDMAGDDGAIERLAVRHVDPEKIELARELARRYPERPDAPYSVAHVIATGQPVMISDVTDDLIIRGAGGDEERAAMIRALGIVSYMCVPLLAQGRGIGALTFVAAESRRRFTDADLRFAQDVAYRAALAVENARAYEEVRRANQLKDEFLATLSHELRTPLNAILGYSRMLRSGVLARDKQDRAFGIVERNASVLTQIVSDILDVSRIVSGKVRLQIDAVELDAIVRDAIATVQPAAEAKGVAVHPHFGGEPVEMRADAERLQQVVWNLLSNAVKFTPKGGRVDVTVQRRDAAATIVVKDTGSGIAPEFLPHVFERFRQADSRFAREHGGLGLGLAIARHLVEMHGGSIRASSEGPGLGATFEVDLPLAAAERPESARAFRQGQESRPRLAEELRAVRVLAVDDDDDSLMLVRDALEQAGAVVHTARSAQEALNALSSTRPQVLISDIGMPGMDGLELIRRIRSSADASTRGVRAAALTAYARSDDRLAAVRAGYDTHLAKPIDPHDLVAAVARLARTPELS